MIKLLLKMLFASTNGKVAAYQQMMVRSKARGWSLAAKICARRLRSFGMFISEKAEIGDNLKFPHPVAIVIGEGVRIAKDVTIYQGVTLGGRRLGDWQAGNYPKIGEGTTIFAGAVIIGDVTIGANCTIGANSVVTRNIPDNATAVGVPARIISDTQANRI